MKFSRFMVYTALIFLVAGGAIWYIIDDYYARQSSSVVMYKNAGCMCCDKWAAYMEDHGYSVRINTSVDVQAVKADQNSPYDLGSCHTALVDSYVVEGHVPADAIKRLLSERPDAVGLAVPGMPAGSPGMEGSYSEPYDVYLFDENGNRTIFASY